MDMFELVSRILGGIIGGGIYGSISLVTGIYLKKVWLGCIGFAISMGFAVLMLMLYRPAALSFFPSAAMAVFIYLLSRKQQKH